MKVTQAASVCRAFGEPTRLRLLALLSLGERCVGDLVTVVQEVQPKVSRHLAELRAAGLVCVRREGRWSHYSLVPGCDPLGRVLLDSLEDLVAATPELARDRRRLERLLASGGCCAPAAARGTLSSCTAGGTTR